MRRKGQQFRFGVRGRAVEPSPLLRDARATLLVRSDGKTLCCTHEGAQIDSKSHVFNNPSVHTLNMSCDSYHNNSEPPTRQRLRPWLESRINSSDIPGLEWMNKDKKIFKVPWKHVGNREWVARDATIFKEWAIHTGRYREGVDTPDYPVWKTRFRCALTKLPDIQELKDWNNLDGQIEEPYRVYMFLPKNKEKIDVPTALLYTREESSVDMMYDDVDGPVYNNGDACPTILPATVNHDTNRNSEEMLDSDLNRIPTGDLIHCPSGDIKHIEQLEFMEISGGSDMQTYEEIKRTAQKPLPGACSTIIPPSSPPKLSVDVQDKKVYITVRYRQEVVYEGLMTNDKGCRIYHDPNVRLDCTAEELCQIFGPVNAFPINLPECTSSNEHQLNMTMKLLNVTDRGVFLSVENGDVFATRKCRCSIFISSPSVNRGETTKLEREQKTKIFDLNEYFLPSVTRYLHDRGTKPSAEVVLGFGQRFDLNKDALNNLLISVTIVHAEASNLLTKIACTDPLSPPIEISKSDNVDRYMDMLQYQAQSENASMTICP